MAIYHLHLKNISRGKGQSVVAAAAYRSGDKLTDMRIGKEYDYSRKENIIRSEIILPKNAVKNDPKKFFDREKLWNSVEQSEKRKDARLAKEVEFALPCELSEKENTRLARKFLWDNIVDKYGSIVDFSCHIGKNNNRHIHALITTRAINDNGTWGKKNRDLDSKDFLQDLRVKWEKY